DFRLIENVVQMFVMADLFAEFLRFLLRCLLPGRIMHCLFYYAVSRLNEPRAMCQLNGLHLFSKGESDDARPPGNSTRIRKGGCVGARSAGPCGSMSIVKGPSSHHRLYDWRVGEVRHICIQAANRQ